MFVKAIRFYTFLITCLLCTILQLTLPLVPLLAQTAINCPNVGVDGSAPPSGIVNTFYQPAANDTLSAGATTINLGTLSAIGNQSPVAVGDLILIIQMQDAEFNSTNTAAYGDGVGSDAREPPNTYPNGAAASALIPGSPSTAASGFTQINNAGLYEYAIVTAVTATTIIVRGGGPGGGLVNTYVNAPATSTRGQRTYQIIRVPQYSSITLSSSTPIVAPPWNGQVGGVMAIDVAGTLTMTGGVVIEASGRGFRGGASRQLGGGTPGINTDFRTLSTINHNGGKAEGVAGTPRHVLNFFDPFTLNAAFNPPSPTRTDTVVEGYPNGSHGRGAPGNAGGGSTDGRPSNNDQNSGGGGGGNGGNGGVGGRAWNSQAPTGGFGGTAFSPTLINNGQRLFMGGGGGGGTTNNGSRSDTRPALFTGIVGTQSTVNVGDGIFSSGGAGGGIIMVRTGRISGTGTFRSRGATGLSTGQDGAGGGGAGGTVYVVALDTTNISGITADVQGGPGGWSTFNNAHGPGGGGGGGVVVSTTPGVISDLAGGQAGRTGPTNNADAANGTHGAIAGTGLATPIAAVGNFGTPPTATCRANILLVKRITALNGINANLTSFIDETNPPNENDDNNPSWIPGFLVGGGTTNPADPFATTLRVTPGDTLDYTIYFVNAGGNRASNFRICDPIPPNTEFVPNTYNNLPGDGGIPSDQGISLAIGSSTPTAFLTNINDPPDRGQFYPAGQVPINCFDTTGTPITSNPNGIVAVNINRTPTFPDLPANTVIFPSTQNYGFVRFRVRVR